MTFTQGHALVIGVGTYQHIQSIAYTATDAEVVAQVLRNPDFCGYPSDRVKMLTHAQATRENVLAELERLSDQAAPDDTVFVFYSGHGEHGKDRNYHLTTHETQIDWGRVVPGTAVSQHDLIERFRAIKAQRLLFICNACSSGALSPVLNSKYGLRGASLPSQASAALLGTGSGRIIITAASEDQVSFIGDGPLTLFGQALVDGLQGKGLEIVNQQGFISVFDLYTHLYTTLEAWIPARVAADIRAYYDQQIQQPELTILKGRGPFAVALYRGTTEPGTFASALAPEPHTAVREIDPALSQRILAKMLQGSFQNNTRHHTIEGNHNQLIHQSTGDRSHHNRQRSTVDSDQNRIGTIRDNHGQISIGRHSSSHITNGGVDRRLPQFAKITARVQASDATPVLKQRIITSISAIEQIMAEHGNHDSPEIAELLSQLDHLSPAIGHEIRMAYGWGASA